MINGFVFRALFSVLAVLYSFFSLYGAMPESVPADVAVQNEPISLGQSSGPLTILQSRTEIGQSLQEAVDLYSAANGGVRISVQTVSNPADYQVALRSKLLSGQKVDLFQIQGRQEAIELRESLEDLSDMKWLHGAIDGMLNAVTFEDGAIVGVPYSVEGSGLIVNRRIFEVAGIPTGNMNSMENMEKAFKELQEMIDAGELAEEFPELEAVTEFAAQDTTFLGGLVSDIILADSFETPVEAAQSAYISIPHGETMEDLIRVMALYSSCTRWEQLNEVTQSRQIEDGLASGRVAAILQTTDVFRRVGDISEDVRRNLRLVPIPVEDGRGVVYTGVPVYWAVHAGAAEENKTEAKSFLTWLYRSDQGTAVLAGRFQAVSPWRDTAKDTGVSIQNQMLLYTDENRGLQIHNEYPPGWQDGFAEGVQEYLARDITWEAFLQRCKEDWNRKRSV